MSTEEDKRFAEAALKAGAMTSEQVLKCFARVETMAGVRFAEVAVIMRMMTAETAIEVAKTVRRPAGAAAADRSTTAQRPAPGGAAPAGPPPNRPRAIYYPPGTEPGSPGEVRPLGAPPPEKAAPMRTQALPALKRGPSHQPPAPAPQPPAPAPAAQPSAGPPLAIKTNIKLEAAPDEPPAPTKKDKTRTRRIDLTQGGFNEFDIRPYLTRARELGASDLHITIGRRPFVRVHGNLVELDGPVIDPEHSGFVIEELVGEDRAIDILKKMQGELLLKDEQGRRYRCCALKQRLGWDLAIRIIRETIPTVEELGLPKNLLKLTEYQQGLVLIAGPGGSGKSSTLAALLQAINTTREGHIITVEDPVEYVFEPLRSHVTQREVVRHTESYAKALRAALRENPDVIAIGELRDRETASIAISAAETGHLVFATLHTGNATRTVASLVDMFPPGQRQQLLTMLSESIRGVICQQLVPGADKRSRHLALEVLLFTPAVGSLVRDDKTAQLVTQMQTGRKLGMCRLDDSLDELLKARKISLEEAQARAESKERFKGGR